MENKYLVRRRNDSCRLVYYSHFDGRYGIPSKTKQEAPRFEKEMADKIVFQLERLDNREWHAFEEIPKEPIPEAPQ